MWFNSCLFRLVFLFVMLLLAVVGDQVVDVDGCGSCHETCNQCDEQQLCAFPHAIATAVQAAAEIATSYANKNAL